MWLESEATEKAFYDKKLSETDTKQEVKTPEIDKLSTKIDQMTTRSAPLKGEVATLQNARTEFAVAQAEMDKLRLEKTGTFREHYNWRKGTDWTLLQLKQNRQIKLVACLNLSACDICLGIKNNEQRCANLAVLRCPRSGRMADV